MVINKQNNNHELLKLKEVFSKFRIDFYKCIYKPVFNVFCFYCDEEKLLGQKWEEVVSYIASNFQIDFETDFEKWNLYVLFFVKEKCSITLKYEIENDKFSSRKIVIDNCTSDNRNYRKIIASEIFDNDIILKKNQNKTNKLKLTGKIFNLIKDSQFELNSDKKTRNKSVEEIYDKLLKTYNNEV